MTEMIGEAWPPMSVPDLAPDDDDDDDDDKYIVYNEFSLKMNSYPRIYCC